MLGSLGQPQDYSHFLFIIMTNLGLGLNWMILSTLPLLIFFLSNASLNTNDFLIYRNILKPQMMLFFFIDSFHLLLPSLGAQSNQSIII